MEALPKELQDWGLVGGLLIGMFLLVRGLMLWMQGRIDAKDALLAEQHDKALEVSNSVIALATETGQKTTTALAALTEGVKDMGREICTRMDRTEGDDKTDRAAHAKD